jgi:transcriptional regulator with GAF, ATPase, and Fis domain
MGDALDSTLSRATPAVPASPSHQATLTLVHPVELAVSVAVGTATLVAGRSSDGWTVDHPTVSRRHFSLSWDAGISAHVAEDLGSHNGSCINGKRIGTRRAVPHGAVIRLGDVLCVYERGAASSPAPSSDALPGRATSLCDLRAALADAASDEVPVLLMGETGTGKERIAAELHRLSGRAGKLVAVNCAALSPQLVESQLFGHVRGAFTGASEAQPGLFRAADGGTLFLDEIGELPLALQPKLLRAVQEGEILPVGSTRAGRVDTRVVAATNRDLSSATARGEFRADLYARLSRRELRVPPLRERAVDVLDWIARLAPRPLTFDADGAEALLLFDWPLNLRSIERLGRELTGHIGLVGRSQLPAWLRRAEADEAPSPVPRPTREEFSAAFAQFGGRVHALARHFRRDRRQIYRWIEAFGLGRR